MWIRAFLVLLVAGLVAFHAVRTAAVRDAPGDLGATLWPTHPRVELRRAMTEIGASAARGERLSPGLVRRIETFSTKVPLAPEPLLIKAALAQLDGQEDRAERLFEAARARDPRSEAARYFLADRYLRTGRTNEALNEMSVLARLIPGASTQFAPALASYALTPGAVPELKRLFQASPEFEPLVLFQLAARPEHADRILALWSGRQEPATASTPDWKGRLITGLVEQRQFQRAGRVWSRVSGVSRPTGIFNPEFRKLPAPPPFNWTFPTVGGVAEPGDQGLQTIYFGRQDAVLAEQLLLLAPGRYRLSMTATGGSGDQNAVGWTIRCAPDGATLAQLPIGTERQRRRLQVDFAVPAGCAAQRLQLAGTAGEFSRSVEFTIAGLQLDGPRP